jgi:Domain of unknown function (DUF4386)
MRNAAMSTVLNANDNRPLARTQMVSGQTYARVIGVLFLLSFVAGGFGEIYVPSRLIVAADPAATAANFQTHVMLFRMSFASYLIEAMCDIGASLAFYVLLAPVRKDLSLLAAFFGLVGTAVYAVAELFYFAASFTLGRADYLKSFSAAQLNTLAMLSLKLFGYGGGLFLVFYGVATFLRGYLISRSGYLPKFIGVLVMLGGVGFIARNFALVLAPSLPSASLLLLVLPGVLSLGVWLLVRGVDVPTWEAKTATLHVPTS